MTKAEELMEKIAKIIVEKMNADEAAIKFFIEENTKLRQEIEQLKGGDNNA